MDTATASVRVSRDRNPRRVTRWKHRGLASAALAATVALVVAGCTGQSTGGGESDQGGKAGSGAILRIGAVDAVDNFNPFDSHTVTSGTAQQTVYPQLAQFTFGDDGFKVVPDLATSWERSADGKTWTYHLRSGAKWSDGKPITADDAAWSINTVVKFQEGPTGEAATLVSGVSRAEAADPTTLVVHYKKPVVIALKQLTQVSILPRHVWEKHAGGNGQGIRTFRPFEAGKLVSGGPYLVKQYEKKGTTVFVRNPDFYGTSSKVKAVAVTFYTNTDAELEDLQAGELDWVPNVPFTAVSAVEGDSNIDIVTGPSGLIPFIGFNSNPRKQENRELLDPRVKDALMMCVDRKQIDDVIFRGYADPAATLVGSLGGKFEDPDIKPPPYNCGKANRRLDQLGYKRGPDGVRVVPATTGKDAQPQHEMSYVIVRPNSSAVPYDVHRMYQIFAQGWKKLGVDVTEKNIGDSAAEAAYTYGDNCNAKTLSGYQGWDMRLTYSVAEITAVDTLGGETTALWCAWNFSGYDNPTYDKMYDKALTTLDQQKRQQILWRMQKIHTADYATTPLVEVDAINAHSTKWTGFVSPVLAQYSKSYFTSPHPKG